MADNNVLRALDVVDNTSSITKLIKSHFGKNSINRMAKDTMLQVPVIADSSIHSQTLSVINKCIERRTAALLMSVFSLNPYISLKKHGSIGNYIRTYYDNDRSPIALPSTESATDMFVNVLSELGEAMEGIDAENVSLDSATLFSEGDFKYKVDPQVSYEAFIGTEAALNDTDLNYIYNPTVAGLRRMEKTVESFTIANEKASLNKKAEYFLDDVNKVAVSVGDTTRASDLHGNTVYTPQTGTKENTFNNMKTSVSGVNVAAKPVESSLEPTLIEATFNVGNDKNTVTQQSVVIGIQAVMRTLKLGDMVETLRTAGTGSVGAFKMIKYLKGERNFADWLLGIADAKSIARPKTVGEKVLANLKRRKVDKIFKNVTGGPKPLPITWLVVSQAAVDEVKNSTGIDLNEPWFATQLMNEYYFLGFMIVDESLDLVRSLLDGDSTFAETTVRALTNSNKSKYDLADDKVNTLLAQGRL